MKPDRKNNAYMLVYLDGKELSSLDASAPAHLSAVTVKDSLDKLDSVDVTFELPQGTGDALGTKLDLYAKTFKVELCRDGSPIKEFSGDLLTFAWTRSAGSPRSVQLTGVDHMHRLRRGRKAPKANDRRFAGKKHSEVIEQVAKDWSLKTGGIESTSSTGTYFEWKGEDSALLKHLAEENGYTVRIESEKGSPSLIFSRAGASSGEDVELEFGVDILEMQATHDLDKVLTSVTFTGQKALAGEKPIVKEVKADAAVKDDKYNKRTGPSLVESEIGPFIFHQEDKGGATDQPTAAEAKAKGKLKGAANEFVKGSLTCRFTPEISCGKKVVITGAGWPFDGTFTVGDVTHTLDASGYRTQVAFKGNSIN